MIFITYKQWFLGLGAAIVAVSLGLILTLGVPLGIDFTGGSLTEISYAELPEKERLETALAPLNLGQFSLRPTVSEDGRDGYVLRTRDLTEEERIAVEDTMRAAGAEPSLERFTSVGPVIGQELRDKAVWAIGGVVAIIVLYVAYAFRQMGHIGPKAVPSWVYGLITITVLIHDVLVPTAVFSLLGFFAGAEADVLFVMAMLAIFGYSVNDTIVVFDRVRENLLKNQTDADQLFATHGKAKEAEAEAIRNEPFGTTIGRSVSQTLLRSINTSVTTGVALLALYLFGGELTQTFSLMLLAGVIAGAFSSVALASPLLAFVAERLPDRDPEEEARKAAERTPPGMPPGIPQNS